MGYEHFHISFRQYGSHFKCFGGVNASALLGGLPGESLCSQLCVPNSRVLPQPRGHCQAQRIRRNIVFSAKKALCIRACVFSILRDTLFSFYTVSLRLCSISQNWHDS